MLSLTGGAAGPACDPDNGGLTLPQGFCATVVAENIGPARHLVVAPNGDLYVSTQNGGRGATGGVVALHDSDGDGKMDKREKFGTDGATGVALRNGYVYYATTNSIVRQKLDAGAARADRAARGDRRRADRSASARGQRDRLRRQGRRLREHRRAVQCVSGSGSPAEGRRPGSVSAARRRRRHLALRREQARTEAGRRQALRDRPAADARA